MSRTLDVLTDVEHGTVEGYRSGCRGSHCPAGDEHGLSCSTANRLAAGDWQYMKAIQRGLAPKEIAALLGLHPAGEKPAPKNKHDDLTIEVDQPVKEKTMNAVPVPPQKQVRAWAREHGIDVPARGTLSRAVIDAYNAREKGIQASDVKPAVEPAAETIDEEPVVTQTAEPPTPPTSGFLGTPDWSLPLASEDLRAIADAIDALDQVPRNVLELDRIPVLRPGGEEVIGDIVSAAGFENDPWFGFVPRGAA